MDNNYVIYYGSRSIRGYDNSIENIVSRPYFNDIKLLENREEYYEENKNMDKAGIKWEINFSNDDINFDEGIVKMRESVTITKEKELIFKFISSKSDEEARDALCEMWVNCKFCDMVFRFAKCIDCMDSKDCEKCSQRRSKQFPAHRLLLAYYSEKLKQKFNEPFIRQNLMMVEEFTSGSNISIQKILKYLYKGEEGKPKIFNYATFKCIYELAVELEIPMVIDYCIEYPYGTFENAQDFDGIKLKPFHALMAIYKHESRLNNTDKVKEVINRYFCKNIDEYLENEDDYNKFKLYLRKRDTEPYLCKDHSFICLVTNLLELVLELTKFYRNNELLTWQRVIEWTIKRTFDSGRNIDHVFKNDSFKKAVLKLNPLEESEIIKLKAKFEVPNIIIINNIITKIIEIQELGLESSSLIDTPELNILEYEDNEDDLVEDIVEDIDDIYGLTMTSTKSSIMKPIEKHLYIDFNFKTSFQKF